MALVLAVGGVRELLPEGVGGVEERARQLSVGRERQGLAEHPVACRIEHECNRVTVGHRGAGNAQHLAHRGRQGLLVVRLPVDEPGHAAVELAVELGTEFRAPGTRAGQILERRVLGRLLERQRVLQNRRVERVVPEHFGDHLRDDLALLDRSIVRLAQPPVAEERDARDRVVQVREGRHRKHVPRDLLRAFLDRSTELLPAVPAQPPGKEPEVALTGERRQKLGQAPVRELLASRGRLENLPLRRAHRRYRVIAGLDLDVPLRDLLGVVERVAVQEAPEELPGDVLESKLEVRMLKRRVVAGLVDRLRERVAPVGFRRRLVLGDDAFRRVTRPRRRDNVLERALESVNQAHLRRRRGELELGSRVRNGRHGIRSIMHRAVLRAVPFRMVENGGGNGPYWPFG